MTGPAGKAPRVTVVIPVYNYERFIRAAIESVVAQTFVDWELVIVDDHSTDGTPEIAARYADGERIRLVRNERNLGQFPTHNRGAELARGHYIKFFHGDDIMYPHYLDTVVPLMDAFPSAGLGISHDPWPWIAPRLFAPIEAWRAELSGQTSMLSEGPSGTIFRAEAFRTAGGFDGRFRTGDTQMNLRIAMRQPVLLLPNGLWWYRHHENQVSAYLNWSDVTAGESIEWMRELLASPECPLARGDKEVARQALMHDLWRRILGKAIRGQVGRAHKLWRRSDLPLRTLKSALWGSRRIASDPVRELRAPWLASGSLVRARGGETIPSAIAPSSFVGGDNPLVSVLISARNAAETIQRAIDSVIAQSFANWELVVVDNASADETFKLAAQRADGNQIRCYHNAEIAGGWPNWARTAGLARGRYIKFLDAQDCLYPHSLEIFCDAASRFPDVDVIISCNSAVPAVFPLPPGDAFRYHFLVEPILAQEVSNMMLGTRSFLSHCVSSDETAAPDRLTIARMATASGVTVCSPGTAYCARRYSHGIGTNERYPMGLAEGIRWQESIVADARLGLSADEQALFCRSLRYGFSRRVMALVLALRWGDARAALTRNHVNLGVLLWARKKPLAVRRNLRDAMVQAVQARSSAA